ncbi:MAG: sugar ABC transporter substrate-binding protein [Chloroflexi bacterium]|nr:sugar ABC transporter substrate-binding protein [Chloroflexota bacterium]
MQVRRSTSRRAFLRLSLGSASVALLAACAAPPTPTPVPPPKPAAPTATTAPAKPAEQPKPAPATPTQVPAKPAAVTPTQVPAKAAVATPTQALAKPAAFDWQKHKGTVLRYVGEKQPLSDHVMALYPEFEKLTGIKVNFEILPWAQMVQKLRVELMAGNADLDVFQLPASAEERNQWYDAGWLTDMGKWVDDPALTHPGYDLWDDLGRDYLMTGYSAKGKLVSIPMQMSAMIGYHNKEVFKQFDIPAPPADFTQLESIAKTIHEKSQGKIYGIVLRGKPPVPTSVFKGFLGGMGVGTRASVYEDQNGRPLIDSEAAIAAFDLYGRLLRLYGPPGSANIDHVGAVNIFSQGKAGMVIDDAVFRQDFQDSTKSAVAGKVGYFIQPKGPKGHVASAGGWSISVGGLSKKKEASWYFVQWLSNKENMVKYVLAKGPAPRKSPYEDARYKAQATQDDLDYVKVLLDSRAIGDFSPPAPPSIINVMKARDSISQVIVASIEGKDVRAAAKKSQVELEQMLEEEKKQQQKK